MQTMPFSGTTAHAHTQASLHAITRDAPFILIIFIITMYIPFFIRGRTHTRMHPLFADALSMCQLIIASCCGNNSSSATLSASMLSASHKSICCMSCEATV